MALWFDPGIRPVQPGVYPVRVPNLNRAAWARWTGEFWTCWALSPERAMQCRWPGIRDGYEWKFEDG